MNRYAYGAAALLWMGTIFLFSSQPGFDTGLSFDVLIKKLAHFAGYAVLSFLLAFTIGGKSRPISGRIAWTVLILCVLYAVSDEFHQGFVPGRHPSPWDVLIDSAGAASALIFLRTRRDRHERVRIPGASGR